MNHSEIKPLHSLVPPSSAGVIWVLCCGLVDWLTGSELALSAFYLPGIILTAWYGGRKASLSLAFLAAGIWLAAELLGPKHYSRPFIVYWNSAIRLSIFCLTALLTSEVRIRRLTEAALQNQKEILTSILDSMRDGVVVADREGRIIVFNPAAGRLFGEISPGISAEDWVDGIEKGLLDPAAGSPHDRQLLRKSISGQHSGYGEIPLSRTNNAGNGIRLGLTALPLLGKNADRTGTVLVLNDLTSRRNLENQISQASEREQRRIGHDLHDGVCQHLAGVAFAVGTFKTELERMNLPRQAGKASEIGELIREGIQQTKDLARGLYPMGIEEGLDVALGLLASTTTERMDVQCHYQQTGDRFTLGTAAAGHLYRIAQEAVSNAVRHAKTDNIHILLAREADQLIVEVSDDGIGLDSSCKTEPGIGLQIMRYRANLAGAKLEIISQDDKGTRISCKIPLVS
ncbi:PAS domain S-box protein [Luteolibacter yonseiensis]|uniref:Oxygen sensor histidine kinase NreB n=1 Tax=Luteolibacter yonseiensis TaxID=1144680 RepID=A0A934R0B5_9BACT|nr:ATP-binding protein [Luteolibacter yonseiensis]MBK1814394.1 PAS domain S-box protein [Luteolibacter yonseiensis]